MTLLRRPGMAVITLLILLMGAAFLTQVVPYGQIVDSRRQVADARAQLAELQTENQELQDEVDALGTDAEIEKLAREKLGYVRPGETAFVVLDPPGTPEVTGSQESSSAPAAEETWVDKVWDFITGADLGS
jgi:cell division protein FtsL